MCCFDESVSGKGGVDGIILNKSEKVGENDCGGADPIVVGDEQRYESCTSC